MKARFLSLLAVVLCLVSCQRDADDLNVAIGGEQDVMLTVSLPETTRATDSALGFNLQTLGTTYDLRYILEIYRVDANGVVLYDNCQRFVETSDNSTMVFPVRLAPGYNYRIVAWADIVDEGSKADRYYYTEEGLDNVVIKDNNTVKWNAMDETRDAYTGLQTITFNKTSDLKDMVLTRPFAKVRVVATDITDIREVGLEPTTATVTYSQNMYFKYNAVADVENKGVAEGAKAKSHTYTYAQTATKYDDATGEFTLFTDYIFVPELRTAKFELSVKDQKGGEIKYNHFNTEIFVERNKLTTIKGDVLTTGGNIKVTVNNGLGVKETYTYVDTAEDLQDKINNAADDKETNISLGGDIDLGAIAGILSTRASEAAGLVIPAQKKIVLDLNGHTIEQEKECSASYSMIENKGNLTILDSSVDKTGKISFKDTSAGDPNFGWGSYTLRNEGTLLVKSGTIEHLGEQDAHMICALFQYSGSTTIDGGKISTPYYRSARLWHGDMTINGGDFEGQLWLQAVAADANLTINGGTFAPRGGDYSSVFVSNIDTSGVKHNVAVSVTGGHFTTKIGMSEPFACITGGTFTTAAKEGTNVALINDDLEWTEAENGNWTLTRKPDVAKIGEVGYTSLQKAIDAVKEGETIVVENNITITEGINNNGVSYTRGASFTLDLNGQTVTSNLGNNALRFKIGDGNDVTNTNVTIEIKNGTVISGDSNWCAISAATASNSENKLTINLNNVTVYNSKAGDYGVKAWEGATINATDVTINATKCAGGFYAVGGEIILDNCTVNQKGLHTAPYMSMAIAVSTKGKLTVNSGNYTTEPTAAAEGYNQGTSHGSWCAGVMNSGGELIINGGTFANGNFGDDALATAARGLIFGDTASKIVINDGTFNALKTVIDYQNNLGVQPNPNIVINGGNFSANPAIVTSYGGVVLAEGKVAAQGADGRWTLVDGVVDEAGLKAAFEQGGNIVLGADITVAEPVVLAEGKTAVLDLNGKKILGGFQANSTTKHIYPFDVYGSLTIKDSSKDGSIEGRGIFVRNGATFTVNSGSIYAIDSDGGSAIWQYGGDVVINGGLIEQKAKGTYNFAVNGGGGTVTVNGGKIAGNHGAIATGAAAVELNAGEFVCTGTEGMTDNVLYSYGTGTITINGGTFTADNDGPSGGCCVYDANGGVTINGGVFGNSSGGDVWGTTGTTIKGGKFENLIEKQHIAKGYELNANGVVVAK